jgi:hypothetical protein
MAAANLHLAKLSDADRGVLEGWLVEFDQSWHEKRLAFQVRQLPPADNPLRLAALIEMVKIDLERQWQMGRRAVIEGYLKFIPELGTSETVPEQIILTEYEIRRQHGASSDLTEFGKRFPRQLPELRRLIQLHSAAESSWPGSGLSRVRTTPSTPRPGDGLDLTPRLPKHFGRYEILKIIGKGGMGTVYLAEDSQLKRQVALKVPHLGGVDDAEDRERFQREARAAANVSHPNVCPIYDVAR